MVGECSFNVRVMVYLCAFNSNFAILRTNAPYFKLSFLYYLFYFHELQ